MPAHIQPFFDPASATFTYVVHGDGDARCAIIDPVLGLDVRHGRLLTEPADRVAGYVRAQGLAVEWLLETHVHADHVSASAYLKGQLGGRIGISRHIVEVQRVFGETFNLAGLRGPAGAAAGADFDHLFGDDEPFTIGSLPATTMHVPGHTPADIAYRIDGDAVFVGDTLFHPDVGTARCDFPGGDATRLYRSIRRLLSLPPETRLFLCHDYPPAGRPQVRWQTDVLTQRRANVHVRDEMSMEDFVAMRTARDATLALPNLYYPSVQINIRAGRMPEAEDNGTAYLKVPLALHSA
ncbi:MBL fold metallo-hydrolase [Cupriavidus plantarum]|uniref:MBL fold metallo-hydrolase n=1 Tax=Cupriavidus plantarum TaxID=942865 RepID=UPI000EB4E320|nr:MBL fold metallo-hydrolase [Cupriavidus plantarum]RLK30049.1 glyoxylase-like metal-dependent hydrolase (beta-lactamase superfamily II) [Cupriavidus plantarum]